GRDHTAHLLLHFEEPERARAFVRTIGDRVTSAAQQLIEAEVFKQTCKPAGRFLVFFLSCTGYRALEVDENKIPKEKAFGDGMKERVRAIDDRPVDTWDQQFQQQIHAMVLIADDTDSQVRQHLWSLRRIARQYGVREIGIEIGKAIKNKHGKTIEHFR